ncbi:MAG: carboxypeptidase-like regulatory domain-containing protein, partial [bacterium]|nr:carboxypeptidase-like regulatory domain-containing protein [bacterium]
IGDATIEMFQEEEMKYSGISRANGYYDIPLIKVGSYDVVFNHTQAIVPVTEEDVVISEIQTTNLDAALQP